MVWNEKACVDGWLVPVALAVFLDTGFPLAHNNVMKILWSKGKNEQK